MKFFKKGALEILWPFHLYNLIAASFFIMPVFFVVYFLHIGLSVFQIGILMAAYPLASLLFEVPTGAVADIYGRKFSVMLGLFTEGISLFLVYLSNNFYYLIFVMFIFGITKTFSTGSAEAWIVDLVTRKKRKDLVHTYFVKEQFIIGFGLIISGILGAFLVSKFGVGIIWAVTGGILILSFFILGFAEEIFVRRKAKIKDSLKDVSKQTKKTISYGYKHPVLYYFLIAMVIMMFAYTFSSLITWVPFLKSFNFPDYAFGYLQSGIAAVAMIAPFCFGNLHKKIGDRNFIIFGTFMSALIIAFILLPKSWVTALIVILSSSFFFDMKRPVSRSFFHKFIPSKLRATMGSVEAMLASIALIISTPIVGYLVDLIGPRYSIFLTSILSIPIIFIYLRIKEK